MSVLPPEKCLSINYYNYPIVEAMLYRGNISNGVRSTDKLKLVSLLKSANLVGSMERIIKSFVIDWK